MVEALGVAQQIKRLPKRSASLPGASLVVLISTRTTHSEASMVKGTGFFNYFLVFIKSASGENA